ncbi:substrate-binding domain-containing protein [Streptomyces sp. enrichment culture]|uniref:substrate-binding domain-containing protein n=1 Tax=Streptomyces sp. enrichment culture TaxID=1795815 RepID=UPI003F548A9A
MFHRPPVPGARTCCTATATVAARQRPAPGRSRSTWSSTIRTAPGPSSSIFAASDQMALGAIEALRRRGRPVPEDMSIVGSDDLPESRWWAPPLTTVRQLLCAVGMLNTRLFLDLARNVEPASTLGGVSSIRPDQGAAPGAVHRKAEEGADAMGVPPCSSGAESLGESGTDDNAARRGARRREPGMIGETPPRGQVLEPNVERPPAHART